MRDKAATMKAVADWPTSILAGPATVGQADAGRAGEDCRRSGPLHRRTPGADRRKTLVMPNLAYRNGLFEAKRQATQHLRHAYRRERAGCSWREKILTEYLRGELGYNTDIAYTDLEDGYMPLPGPARRSTEAFRIQHVEITPEAMERMKAGGGPPLSQPWLQNAIAPHKDLKSMWLRAVRLAQYVRGKRSHEREAGAGPWPGASPCLL